MDMSEKMPKLDLILLHHLPPVLFPVVVYLPVRSLIQARA